MVMQLSVGQTVALREINQHGEWSSAMKNGFEPDKAYYVIEVNGSEITLSDPNWPFFTCAVGDPEDIIPYEKG